MKTYKRHRFPPEIISYAVWLYYRFNLSHSRGAGPFVEDLLAERGITVSYESIRLWCIKFGAMYETREGTGHVYRDLFGAQSEPGLVDQMRRATMPRARFRSEVEAIIGPRAVPDVPGRPR